MTLGRRTARPNASAGFSGPLALVVLLGLVAGSAPSLAEPRTYRVDTATSRIAISVGKAGFFAFAAGHAHEVVGPVASGEIDFDPDDPAGSRVRVVVRAAELKVDAAKEPPGDAPKIQETMDGAEVLNVEQYPDVRFESTGVVVRGRNGSAIDLTVAGRLLLHGTERSIVVPVRAEIYRDALTAAGRMSVKQSDYGMTPVTVAGGLVKVRDRLEITFSIVAR
jgi:polyisoprenoid-binding protein YceI